MDDRVDSCREVACFLIFMFAPGARKAKLAHMQARSSRDLVGGSDGGGCRFPLLRGQDRGVGQRATCLGACLSVRTTANVFCCPEVQKAGLVERKSGVVIRDVVGRRLGSRAPAAKRACG